MIFTDDTRAGCRRECFVSGKRTLIYNKLPRFPWNDGEVMDPK